MNKQLLIRFFNKEDTEKEIDQIIEWVDKSEANRKYFAELKAIYEASKFDNNSSNNNITPKRISFWKKSFIKYTSVAAVFAIAFFLGLSLNSSKRDNTNIQLLDYNITGVEHLSFYTEKGVKGFIILPDSSKVWLNSDTKITFPQSFYGNTRNVKLEGEAYFEVRKDSLHPMIVETQRNFNVKVLGTSFNLKCYPNDSKAEATLYSGRISMVSCINDQVMEEIIELKPNQSFIFEQKVKFPKLITNNKPDDLKAWKEGSLIFKDTPMDEVFKILERWHGTNFVVNNPNIYNYKLSAHFSSESIIQIMEIIDMIMNVDYKYDNNCVTIY